MTHVTIHPAHEAQSVSELANFDRRWLQKRSLVSMVLTGIVIGLTFIAVVPLFSILAMLLYRGVSHLTWEAFRSLPPAAFEEGGGFGNAIVGTLVMVAMATSVSGPLGILGAIYLSEIGKQSRLANCLRLCAKTLNGLPSILAGVFIYGVVVLGSGGFSAFAGAMALSLLMVPTILLVSEEALRGVSSQVKEAAIAMGATRTQVILKVILPSAFPGILTGVMLAIARAAGETAPLLFTALFSNYWILQGNRVSLTQPTASLSVLIYNFSGSPFENQVHMAWSASLVLVLLVLTTNLIGKSFSRQRLPR